MTKTRTSTARPSSTVLEPAESLHVGVDVHKRPTPATAGGGPGGFTAPGLRPAPPEAPLERLEPLRGRIAAVVYESGPTGFGLARRLKDAGLPVQVIAASRLLVPRGPSAKSDRLDCRRLAMLSQKGLLHPVRVPTAQEEADRQVLRLRDQSVRKARAAQQQIKSFLLMHGIPEPAGLEHWSATAVATLRRLELGAELRFCLDLLLDELTHARSQVARVT